MFRTKLLIIIENKFRIPKFKQYLFPNFCIRFLYFMGYIELLRILQRNAYACT